VRRAASRTTAKVVHRLVDVVSGVGQPLLELDRLVLQRGVGQRLDLGFEGVDVGDDLPQRLDLPALTGAQDLREDTHGGAHSTGVCL
jgi:hypothetical protein